MKCTRKDSSLKGRNKNNRFCLLSWELAFSFKGLLTKKQKFYTNKNIYLKKYYNKFYF